MNWNAYIQMCKDVVAKAPDHPMADAYRAVIEADRLGREGKMTPEKAAELARKAVP